MFCNYHILLLLFMCFGVCSLILLDCQKNLISTDNIAKTAFVISLTVVFYVIAFIVAYKGLEEFLLLNSSIF